MVQSFPSALGWKKIQFRSKYALLVASILRPYYWWLTLFFTDYSSLICGERTKKGVIFKLDVKEKEMLRGRASRLKYFNFRHKIRLHMLVGALQLVVVAFFHPLPPPLTFVRLTDAVSCEGIRKACSYNCLSTGSKLTNDYTIFFFCTRINEIKWN